MIRRAGRGPRVLAVVSVAVLCVLGLGGCRGGDRTAAAPRSAPAASGSAGSGSVADPLAGIESSVDAVERDVDTDSRADSPAGR